VPQLLVDARNVLRSTWPNLGEDEVVRLACSWAAGRGLHAVLVFDGRAPKSAPSDECFVVGSGAESADDVLARTAAELAGNGEPYWLVTSDRELRARAGRDAERMIGGGAFADELKALR